MKAPRIVRRPLPAISLELPGHHPVVRRIFAARGVTNAAQVEYRLAGMLPPTLGGLERACDVVCSAIRAQQRIVVVGDFDCDGATGTAVAVRGLRLLGARNVGYGVPNRAVHGYGLSPALVEELCGQSPDLLITVDNGVAAHAGIAAAHARGMRVVVTDHHLPGATLPNADAMVNPNLPGDAFASKALAGVGVMFYLLLALRASLRADGWFAEAGIADPDLSVLLDLVALGTVADLVALDHNNRILVEAGLRRIRSGRGCAGITALFSVGKRDIAKACAADLGFIVAPRLNAAGRIDDISLGIECLLADDVGRARGLADRLGLAFLDTGAMYRAITWLALEESVDLENRAAVARLLDHASIEVDLDPRSPAIAINGVDVSDAIRAPEVSKAVSAIATNLDVRAHLIARQKKLITEAARGIVAEGRDITTVVAPDADLRVLLVADPAARVARRHAELAEHQVDVDAVHDQVIRRDRDDAMVAEFESAAPGVHVVDSTFLSLEEVIETICAFVPVRALGDGRDPRG